MSVAVVSANQSYTLEIDGRKHIFDDDVEVATKMGFCVACPEPIVKGDEIRFGHYGPHRYDYSKIHNGCFVGLAHEVGYTLPEDRAIELAIAGESTTALNRNPYQVHMMELPPGSYAHRNKYAIYIGDKFIWATSDLRRAEGAVAVLQLLDLNKLF